MTAYDARTVAINLGVAFAYPATAEAATRRWLGSQ